MKRKSFTAPDAVSVGPYSHAVEAGGFVYLSGQTPLDSKTGKLVEGDIGVQTAQVFENLFAVLKAAGLSPDERARLLSGTAAEVYGIGLPATH